MPKVTPGSIKYPQEWVQTLNDMASARFSEEWEPIETARKDGAHMLVCAAGHETHIAYWDVARGEWIEGRHGIDDMTPTHWKPLLEPFQ